MNHLYTVPFRVGFVNATTTVYASSPSRAQAAVTADLHLVLEPANYSVGEPRRQNNAFKPKSTSFSSAILSAAKR